MALGACNSCVYACNSDICAAGNFAPAIGKQAVRQHSSDGRPTAYRAKPNPIALTCTPVVNGLTGMKDSFARATTLFHVTCLLRSVLFSRERCAPTVACDCSKIHRLLVAGFALDFFSLFFFFFV